MSHFDSILAPVFEYETFLQAQPVEGQFEDAGAVQAHFRNQLIQQANMGRRKSDVNVCCGHSLNLMAQYVVRMWIQFNHVVYENGDNFFEHALTDWLSARIEGGGAYFMDEDRDFICQGCGRHTPVAYNVKDLMFCITCKEKADGANAEWLAESKKTYELMKEKSL